MWGLFVVEIDKGVIDDVQFEPFAAVLVQVVAFMCVISPDAGLWLALRTLLVI